MKIARRNSAGVLAACFVINALLFQDKAATAEQDQPVTAITGNGGLTIGVDATGGIVRAAWPGPGSPNQLSNTAQWAIRVGSTTYWLAGPRQATSQYFASPDSCIIQTTTVLPETSIRVEQEMFVHPELDVLITMCRVFDSPHVPDFSWYQDFSPTTRTVPELPALGAIFDLPSDFAAFVEPGADVITQFAPDAPGAADWKTASLLSMHSIHSTYGAWNKFGHGVWIATRSLGSDAEAFCGNVLSTTSAKSFIESSNTRAVALSAVNQCDAGLAIAPRQSDGGVEATVIIAFADSHDRTRELLSKAAEAGYPTLKEQTERYWAERSATARLPNVGDEELVTAWKRCRHLLLMSIDRETGAMANLEPLNNSTALDKPVAGAWITLALDQVGLHDAAQRRLRFYADALRSSSKQGMPAGSLAASLYRDGTEAAPHVFLDLKPAAWFLWSVWQHTFHLSEDQRSAFLSDLWPQAELATDFLISWLDRSSGMPLPSYNERVGRDDQSVTTLLSVTLGIASGVQIARAHGQDRPDWRDRLDECYEAISRMCFDEKGVWKTDALLPADVLEPLAHINEHWSAVTSQVMLGSRQLSAKPVGEAFGLCGSLLMKTNGSERRIDPGVSTALLKSIGLPSDATPLKGIEITKPDTLAAAQFIVACEVIEKAPRGGGMKLKLGK